MPGCDAPKRYSVTKMSRRRAVERWWHRYEWPVVIGLGAVALALGYVGFAKLCAHLPECRSPLDILYLSVQLFVLESGSIVGPKTWELDVARVLAPALALYTAVQALAAIFHDQLDALRLWRMRNHTVVCGLGRRGVLLAGALHECGNRVVAIEHDSENDSVSQLREQGITVLVGDASDPEMLHRARVQKARQVIAISGDDGVNAEVAAHSRELAVIAGTGDLTCHVQISEPRLCELLGHHEVCSRRAGSCHLEFFNTFDTAARALLSEYPPFGDTGDPGIVVVGAGRMGQALISHAAMQWWSRRSPKHGSLRIHVVDRAAEPKVRTMQARFDGLRGVCELIPYHMHIESSDFEQAEFLFGPDGDPCVRAVYICVDNDSLGLTAGLVLQQRLRHNDVPIVVRMTDGMGLSALLDRARGGDDFGNLHAFGMLDRTCRPDLILGGLRETLSRAIHDEYVRTQSAKGCTHATNPSLLPWHELPESLKQSNRRQADRIGEKLAAIGCEIRPWFHPRDVDFAFEPGEIEMLARVEHDSWMADLSKDGWRYAAGPKNPEKKTHPCLVPWDDLPEDERDKDRAAVRGIPGFLHGLGLHIRRL